MTNPTDTSSFGPAPTQRNPGQPDPADTEDIEPAPDAQRNPGQTDPVDDSDIEPSPNATRFPGQTDPDRFEFDEGEGPAPATTPDPEPPTLSPNTIPDPEPPTLSPNTIPDPEPPTVPNPVTPTADTTVEDATAAETEGGLAEGLTEFGEGILAAEAGGGAEAEAAAGPAGWVVGAGAVAVAGVAVAAGWLLGDDDNSNVTAAADPSSDSPVSTEPEQQPDPGATDTDAYGGDPYADQSG